MMRSKLKLDLEQLTVDTFQTTRPQKPRGTVFGQQCTCRTACTCPGCFTCEASCNGTCDNTCANTCDDASCVGTCGATCNTCNYSCGDTQCGYGFTCGNCTALQTNCNEVCY